MTGGARRFYVLCSKFEDSGRCKSEKMGKMKTHWTIIVWTIVTLIVILLLINKIGKTVQL